MEFSDFNVSFNERCVPLCGLSRRDLLLLLVVDAVSSALFCASVPVAG
jgi:hypothetical protein